MSEESMFREIEIKERAKRDREYLALKILDHCHSCPSPDVDPLRTAAIKTLAAALKESA